MKPAGKGEYDSLYFDYPQFAAPSGRTDLSDRKAVAIAGGGPVGMVAALALAKFGVRSVVFDNKSTFNDGSRALCIARANYNLLQILGIADPFMKKALPYLSGRSFFRGKEILKFEMADSADEKYRPMYNLQQQYIEQYIHDGVASSPLIDMRWKSEVTGVEDIDGGVKLRVKDTNGEYDITADWLLAADGARSTVRQKRGLRLKGQNYEGRYVIADVQMKFPHKVERLALFDPDKRPGSTVLVHLQPDDLWRIDYQVRDGESEQDALSEASIREGVAQVLAELGIDAPWELEWWSLYSANTLLLDDYRDGRIFFVGDAAHIVPIFGVRGLNNGIADAYNIAWKLAYVLQGKAQPALLDSYTPERRDATLDVFANASKSARFMTPHSRGYEVMRDAALSLALDFRFAGDFANPRNMTPHTYVQSPITRTGAEAFKGGPLAGATAPNAKLDEGFLLDQADSEFIVLAFGDVAQLELLNTLEVVVKILHLPADGNAARIYGAQSGSAYLLRPDLHIAARWIKTSGAEIAAQINVILQGGTASRKAAA